MKTTPVMPATAVPTRARRSARASSRTGRMSIATLPPETTSRCVRPVAWKSRSVPGSSCASSPRARPSSSPASRGGSTRSMAEPTTSRVAWVARTKWLGEPPSRWTVSARTTTTAPFPARASRKPASSGTCRRPDTATRSPRATSVGASSPSTQTTSDKLTAPSSQRASEAARTTCQPKSPGRGSSRSVPITWMGCGASPARNDPPRRASASPAHPAPARTVAITHTAAAAIGRPVAARAGPATAATAGASAGAIVASGSVVRVLRASHQAAPIPIAPARSHQTPPMPWSQPGRTDHDRMPAHHAPAATGTSHEPTFTP